MLELVNLSFKVNDDGNKKEILNVYALQVTLPESMILKIKRKKPHFYLY